jgi:hypothetical protein
MNPGIFLMDYPESMIFQIFHILHLFYHPQEGVDEN